MLQRIKRQIKVMNNFIWKIRQNGQIARKINQSKLTQEWIGSLDSLITIKVIKPIIKPLSTEKTKDQEVLQVNSQEILISKHANSFKIQKKKQHIGTHFKRWV